MASPLWRAGTLRFLRRAIGLSGPVGLTGHLYTVVLKKLNPGRIPQLALMVAADAVARAPK